MSTTNLQVVNQVLADSNEVQLTSGNFSSAIGVQQAAKNAVERAYLEICAEEVEWPFLRVGDANTNEPYDGNVTKETTAGVRWYVLKAGSTTVAADYAKVDWDSFYTTTEGATGASSPYEHRTLHYISYDHWRENYADDEDEDAGSSQDYGVPKRVIRSKDGRYFGLSPIPDKVYGVYFTAWVAPTKLSAHGDVLLIPDAHVPTLYHKAMHYLYKFKHDYPAAQSSEQDFRRALQRMRISLMPRQDDYMRDDRLRV